MLAFYRIDFLSKLSFERGIFLGEVSAIMQGFERFDACIKEGNHTKSTKSAYYKISFRFSKVGL
jgi:hypothetical protein